MRKFLKNTLIFILGLFLILMIPMIKSSKPIYKLEKHKNTIFIGDSHIQCAVQDALIPDSKSFAIRSESTFFSYFKIRKLINDNPNLEKIYLGFSYHNISSYYDDFIFGKYSEKIVARYFDILPSNEKIEYFPKNISVFYKHYLTTKYRGVKQGYGNRFKNTTAVEEFMVERIKFQFFDEAGDLMKFSDINIQYLKKIKELAANHDLQLIILDTPLHPYYRSMIPEAYQVKYNELIEVNNLTKIDFEEMTLGEDDYAPDGDHVSDKGAEILSLHLNTL